MRLLVTGGAGFIGSHFIRLALSERPDWEIINFDLLTYAGNLQSLVDIESNPRYKFAKGDIANPDDLDKVFSDTIDIVINFAAETHVDKSLYDASRFIRTNIMGVGALLESAMAHKIQRFIQISTDEVYGSMPAPQMAIENDPLRPTSPYAATKASADLLCLSFHKTFNFPVVITRSCNNYGPYQFPEKVIPFFISEALAGKHLPLYGQGKNIRNWIHVEDNCRAILAVIEKGMPGEIYNISGDNYIDNLGLTKKLVGLLNCPESLIKFVEDRPAHDFRYAINSKKIRNLGWSPQIDFDKGLEQTVEWYKAHAEWMQAIRCGKHQQFYENHYKNR